MKDAEICPMKKIEIFGTGRPRELAIFRLDHPYGLVRQAPGGGWVGYPFRFDREIAGSLLKCVRFVLRGVR